MNPLVSIDRRIFAGGVSDRQVSYCRTGAVAHKVYFGPPFDNFVFGVVVFVPKETQVGALMFGYGDLVEHIFDVGGNRIWMEAKP